MEWISVKDRLPEATEFVLIYAVYNGRWDVIIGYTFMGKWFSQNSNELKEVKHWMPRPKPPET